MIQQQSDIAAHNLQCEFFTNPLGIDAQRPRFSFEAVQPARASRQSAYRIFVSLCEADAEQGRAEQWDSGRTESDANANIEYNGLPLQSGTRYYWAVQLFDKTGAAGPISKASWFETALLDEKEWQGCWLGMPAKGPSQLIRREFTLGKEIRSARAYIAGLGYYELWINGKRQGDRLLDPGFTDYTTRIFYTTYDVTEALVQGQNCVGAMLGNGWYKHPCFILQLNVTYQDGSQESIYTEPGKWDMFIGPITNNDIYMGEQYDGRFAIDGWCEVSPDLINRFPRQSWKVYGNLMPWPGYDETPEYRDVYHRSFIALETAAPGGKLQAQPIEPIRIVKRLKPISISSPSEGVYVCDFGENIAGWMGFRVKGPEGQMIVLRYSEILHDDGTVNQDYLKAAELWGTSSAMQTDIYRLRGLEEERFEGHFTYHGFRFVQIEGFPYRPSEEDLEACMVCSDVSQIGNFRCENTLLSKLQENILRTEQDNLHSIPTDCPQRDERMGWLNDMTARYEEAVYNYKMVHIYEKWAQDISDAQDPFSGAIPDTAPLRRGQRPGDPCIASYLLVSKCLLDHYGDLRTVECQYENYKKWTNFLYRQSIDGILTYSFWGDWAGPKDYTTRQFCDAISAITPGELISTGYLYYDLRLMEHFAKVLNKTEEQADFAARAELICESFNREFFHPETASYATGSQASNVFPLYLGIVPKGFEQAVADHVAQDVITHGYHLTTGNLCTKYLPEMLCKYGYTEVAYKLVTQTTYPSWGYMIEMGATTIWERWEYATTSGMNSHNHPMYASISAWFYKYLAGISPDEKDPGYRHFTVKPVIPSELPAAGASLHTVRGIVASRWQKENDALLMQVTVPVSSCATVFLPAKECSVITESGHPLADAEGVTVLGFEDSAVKVRLESGFYQFAIR